MIIRSSNSNSSNVTFVVSFFCVYLSNVLVTFFCLVETLEYYFYFLTFVSTHCEQEEKAKHT